MVGMDLTIILPNLTGFVAGSYYTSQFIKYDSGTFNTLPLKANS